MTPEMVLEILHRATWIILQCAGPVLVIGVSVGLFMGLIQAATQISEPSLTFVPKLIALGASIIAFGPWLLERLSAFSREMFVAIGGIGGS